MLDIHEALGSLAAVLVGLFCGCHPARQAGRLAIIAALRAA